MVMGRSLLLEKLVWVWNYMPRYHFQVWREYFGKYRWISDGVGFFFIRVLNKSGPNKLYGLILGPVFLSWRW